MTIDVSARVQKKSLNDAAKDMQQTFNQSAQEAGKSWSQRFANALDTRGASQKLAKDVGDASHNAANLFRTNLSRGVQEAVSGAAGQFGALGRHAEGALGGILSKGGLAATGVAGIGVAAVAAGAQLYRMGAQWDDVADGISGATGKIGAELDAITGSVKRLSGSVASPIGDIATVTAQVSQATKLTGGDLETLTANVANFQRVTGQTIDTRGLGRVFRLFDVKDVDNQVDALNDLANASWTTGAPVSQLIQNLAGAGKAARQFGLDVGQTAALLTTFEDAGLDFAKVESSLTRALKSFAAAGRDPATALRQTISEIRNLVDTGQDAAAVDLAQSVFGRGYVDFFAAIKSGKLDVDSLDASLKDNATTIDDVTEATADFAEEWQKFSNTIQSGVQPVATGFFEFLNAQMTNALDVTRAVGDGLSGLGFMWGELTNFINGRPLAFQVQMPQGPSGPLPPGYNPTNPLAPGTLTGAGPGTPTMPTNPLDILQGANTGQFPTAQAPPVIPPPGIRPNPWGTVKSPYADWYPKDDKKAGGSDSGGPAVPYTGGDPLSLLQGFPVTASLYGNAESLLQARHKVEQETAELNAVMADNTSTADELTKARNELADAEREAFKAELSLNEAKQASTDSLTKTMRDASGTLSDISAGLDNDLGFSKGLPGLADNLIRFVGTLAAAPFLTQLDAITQADPRKGGYGLMGALGAQGAFGPQFTGIDATQRDGSGGYGGNVNAMMALAQQSSGNVKYGPASDLVGGLADCSGSISDLVEMLKTGTTSPARLFDTTGFSSDQKAAALGFQPGYMPGALNVGVNPYPGQSGHMASTLPNGVNFEGGGATGGGAQYGGSAAGALDPQFERQYHMPIGPPPGMPGGVPVAGPYTGGGGGPLAGGMPQGMPIGAPGATTAGQQPVGKAAGAGGWQPNGGGGIGMGGGLMAAAGTAAMGLDMMAPGAGQAAQTGMELLNRGIKYAGQLGSIGVSGLLETFGLSDSVIGDPSKSWIGRAAAGVAGMAPAVPTSAGQTQAPVQPQKHEGNQQGQQQGGLTINGDFVQGPGQQIDKSLRELQWASGLTLAPSRP